MIKRVIVTMVFAITALLAISPNCPALPPVQTLNFDFGDGRTYVGDDGLLSAPGGTVWNRVTTDYLNNPGLENTFYDEFGSVTLGGVFNVGKFFLPSLADTGWQGNFGSAVNASLIDGIRPIFSGISLDDPGFAQFSLIRVQEFEEMVIYFDNTFPMQYGGFTSELFSEEVAQPFSDSVLGLHSFEADTTIMQNVSYIRLTQAPPRQDALGFGQTITLALPGLPDSGIAAIQIRGAFGLPEPTSVGIACLAIICVACGRIRTPSP